MLMQALHHMLAFALMSKPADQILTAKTALRIQWGAKQANDDLVWVIYARPQAQASGQYIAVPCIDAGMTPMAMRLEASTLEELRTLLPPGLTRIERLQDDDPALIESWN